MPWIIKIKKKLILWSFCIIIYIIITSKTKGPMLRTVTYSTPTIYIITSKTKGPMLHTVTYSTPTIYIITSKTKGPCYVQ